MIGALAASPEAALAGATSYLRLFGLAMGGCLLADEALAAMRHAGHNGADQPGRIALARFFAEHMAAQAPGLARVVTEAADAMLSADAGIGAA